MNYLAHGYRYVDRPWFLAGTAVPDWLSVVDRRLRIRTRHAQPHADGSGSETSELAAGIVQHLVDDDWFHRTPAFARVSDLLTLRFRAALPADEGFRPALLGHIVTEIVLDGVLVQRLPGVLDRYYAALARVDPAEVEAAVARVAGRPAPGVAWFVRVFLQERFLADYVDPARLWRRLNQVMQRVKLEPLPERLMADLEHAQELVAANAEGLLAHFPPQPARVISPRG